MTAEHTIHRKVHFGDKGGCGKVVIDGDAPEQTEVLVGRVPRVTKLMARAIRFDA